MSGTEEPFTFGFAASAGHARTHTHAHTSRTATSECNVSPVAFVVLVLPMRSLCCLPVTTPASRARLSIPFQLSCPRPLDSLVVERVPVRALTRDVVCRFYASTHAHSLVSHRQRRPRARALSLSLSGRKKKKERRAANLRTSTYTRQQSATRRSRHVEGSKRRVCQPAEPGTSVSTNTSSNSRSTSWSSLTLSLFEVAVRVAAYHRCLGVGA